MEKAQRYTFNYVSHKQLSEPPTEPQKRETVTRPDPYADWDTIDGHFAKYGHTITAKALDDDAVIRLCGHIVKSTVDDIVNYKVAMLLHCHNLAGDPLSPKQIDTLRECAERSEKWLRTQYYDLLTMGMGGEAVLKECESTAKHLIEQRYRPVRGDLAKLIRKTGTTPEDIMKVLNLDREQLADWLMYPFPVRERAIRQIIKNKGGKT